VHQQGEARSRPFVAIYEPFTGKDKESVTSVRKINTDDSGQFTALRVNNKNNTEQLIFQSSANEKSFRGDKWQFKGAFGIVHYKEGTITEIYLGCGKEIHAGEYSIISSVPEGAAGLLIKKNGFTIQCNQATTVLVNGMRFNVPAGPAYEIPLDQ
jgi:hypothetical protein